MKVNCERVKIIDLQPNFGMKIRMRVPEGKNLNTEA